MASIEVRTLASGKKVYKAEIVVRVNGKRRKKSATFDRRITAAAWAKKFEKQIKSGDAEAMMEKASKPKTVADAIDKYLEGIRARPLPGSRCLQR
jgi:hypothetical protein